jgi:hypothetical protein
MPDVGDLEQIAEPVPPASMTTDPRSVTTVLVPASRRHDAMDGIVGYFGADAERDVIRLVVGDTQVGFVTRTDLLDLVGSSLKGFGFGDSVGATLPGTPNVIEWIELRCPVPDCPTGTYYEMVSDEEPATCSDHPDQALVPVGP